MYKLCSEIWSMGKYCRTKLLEFQAKGIHGRREIIPGNIAKSQTTNGEPDAKKPKLDENILERNVAFFRTHYPDGKLADNMDIFHLIIISLLLIIVTLLPKSVLHSHATKNRKILPVYETQQVDRLFRTVITFEKLKYASSYWEKNKKFAEQGAALVCILKLGLIEEEVLIKNGSILK